MSAMARSIWSGAISFGLVNVPVKLYSAVSRKTVRFHQLNGETGDRIQQKRVDPETGEEVPYEQIVKGYELTPRPLRRDQRPTSSTRSTRRRPARSTSRTSSTSTTSTRSTTTTRTTSSRTRAPTKAYGLLLERDAGGRQGRDRARRAALQGAARGDPPAAGDVLMMETMLFADEVVPPDELDGLPEAKELKASERELKMAQQLIDSLSTRLRPGEVPRRVPREGARADRAQGGGRGDRASSPRRRSRPRCPT